MCSGNLVTHVEARKAGPIGVEGVVVVVYKNQRQVELAAGPHSVGVH
jgi:hypothetical protein